MRALYVIASGIWQGAKWVWTAIVVAILVSVASAIIPGETDKVVRSVAANIIAWFRIFGPIQKITVGGIFLLTLLALASGVITVILKRYGPPYTPPPEVQA